MCSLLRMRDLPRHAGPGRSTLTRQIKEGLWPPPVPIGGIRCWPDYEVAAVNRARIAGKSDDEIRELVIRLVAARKDAGSLVERDAA